MTLNVQVGVLAAPTGVNGTNVVTLAAGFGLKLVEVLFTNVTADAPAATDVVFNAGWATFDGGSIQQGYVSWYSDLSNTSGAYLGSINTNGIGKAFNTETATVEAVVSCTAFSDTGFTLTWSDPPAAAWKVMYRAIGGDEVTAARVLTVNTSTAVANQSITVNAGFGRPDLVGIASIGGHTASSAATSIALGDATGTPRCGIHIGWGWTNGTTSEQRACELFAADGTTVETLGSNQQDAILARSHYTGGAAIAIEAQATLEPVFANWPTDGFRINFSDQASGAQPLLIIAVKGTFSKKIGKANTLTTGSTQDFALATGTPKAAMFWGTSLPANVAVDITHADLGGYMVGHYDGTTQASCGYTQDDANAVTTGSPWFHSTSGFREYKPTSSGAATLVAVAAASVNGSNIRLTYSQLDILAREFSYLILGETASAAPPILVMPPYRPAR